MAQFTGQPGQNGYVLPESYRQAVHDIARAMSPGMTAAATRIAQQICERDPELQRPEVAEIVQETCQANLAAGLDYLARGVDLAAVAPSEEVVQFTRELVRRGVSERAVTRGYTASLQLNLELWTDAVAAHGPGAREEGFELVKAGAMYLSGLFEVLVERLADEHHAERERLARERSLARLEEVRDVLTATDVDVDAASVRLGYRISGGHRALVLRIPDESADPGTVLDGAVKLITAAVCLKRGFVVRVDMRTAWCWLPLDGPQLPPLPEPAPPVLVAIGGYGTGLSGFRRSLTEAQDAMRVAESAADPDRLTRYDDVDIAAMCAVDVERCRDFVRRELGGLMDGSRATLRNRETLEAFLVANSSYRAAAAILGIHHRTVRYRLEQVEEVLGKPIATRRFALGLALHLLTKLGADQPCDDQR